MPYATCDSTCDNCGEICDNDVYVDYCEDCEQLESELNELKTTQLSEAQERKLEEYERLKTWLLRNGVKPSEMMLGLDHYVVTAISNFMAYRNLYVCEVRNHEELNFIKDLVKHFMSSL